MRARLPPSRGTANACSGNGDCLAQDQCECYDNFFGGDCSLRMCPMEAAFVDIPRGDLNHDGVLGYGTTPSVAYSEVQWSRYMQYEAWPTLDKSNSLPFTRNSVGGIDTTDAFSNVVGGWEAQVGEAHFQMECSGKGTCDRTLGVCNCYDGYTGGACQRTTCPNDCSSHGLCRTVSEIALNAYNRQFINSEAGINYYSGITQPYEYRLWDGDHNSACACDVGYLGVDCSLVDCPRGDDPLTNTPASCGSPICQYEEQSFSVDGSQLVPGTYYLVFTDYTGISFTTPEFPLYTDSSARDPNWAEHRAANEAVVMSRLETLPNNVTGTVTVTSSGGGSTAKDQYRVSVVFTGKSGNVPEMRLGWTGTSNTATLRAYVFQPGQPVQSIYLDSTLGIDLAYIMIKTYPQDQTLYGLPFYWASSCTLLSVSNTEAGESDVADDIVSALNSIPAINLDYGSPFIRDSNVIAQVGAYKGICVGGGCQVGYNIHIAFPDAQFGLAQLQATTYSDSACTIPTGPTPLGQTTGFVPVSARMDVLDGNMEYDTCANRGLCNYGTGLCSCFTGYTGVACETQSTLAR